ncbi:hypothetical protein [Rhizobium leguminosarum]
MAKAILTTKIDPTYDDLPEQRYHFPRTYLRQVEAARGDWIVYYEPRRPGSDLMKTGGRQAYFATARIADIIPDPSKPDHYYALIEDFLPFDHAVQGHGPLLPRRIRERSGERCGTFPTPSMT